MTTRHTFRSTLISLALVAAAISPALAKSKSKPAPAPTPVRQFSDSFALDLGIVSEGTAPAIDISKAKDAPSLCPSAAKFDLSQRDRTTTAPSSQVTYRMQAQSLDANAIGQVVKANSDQIKYCYEAHAAKTRDSAGELALHFSVSTSGSVATATVVAAGQKSAKLEACVVAQVKGWKFPAADAPTDVSYPIVIDVAGTAFGAELAAK